MKLVLRNLGQEDDKAISHIFRSTFVMGKPIPDYPDFDAYEWFSLGWYLTAGRDDARVLLVDDDVVGYVLVCTQQMEHSRWQRRELRNYLGRIGPKIALRRYPKDADRFYRDRIEDGFLLWRDTPYAVLNAEIKPEAHAHFNVALGSRGSLAIADFVAHIDSVCRRDGIEAWLGQMNTKRGQRATVLERYGAQIVDRATNLTLSRLCREPVERLTVVRQIGAIQRLDRQEPLRAHAGP